MDWMATRNVDRHSDLISSTLRLVTYDDLINYIFFLYFLFSI